MENNKCEEIMNRYLMLDKGESVPFSLSLHLLKCGKCRRQISLLKKAEKQISSPLKIKAPVTDSSIEKVIKEITPQMQDKFYKPLPIVGWIIGGIIMIALLLLSVFTTADLNSRGLSIYYAFTFAGCVTAYCSVFIVSNIDLFVKKISTVASNLN